jgi:hypothetical protein
MFVFYFVYCFFVLFCVLSSLLYTAVSTIFVQVYRPLPPGGHPTAVNIYIILPPLHIWPCTLQYDNAAIQLNDGHVLASSAQPTVWPLVGCQGQPEICIRLSTSTWVIKDKVVRLGDVLNSNTDTHSGRVPIASTWVMAAINLSPHADIPSVNCMGLVDSVSSMLQLQRVMGESLGSELSRQNPGTSSLAELRSYDKYNIQHSSCQYTNDDTRRRSLQYFGPLFYS